MNIFQDAGFDILPKTPLIQVSREIEFSATNATPETGNNGTENGTNVIFAIIIFTVLAGVVYMAYKDAGSPYEKKNFDSRI